MVPIVFSDFQSRRPHRKTWPWAFAVVVRTVRDRLRSAETRVHGSQRSLRSAQRGRDAGGFWPHLLLAGLWVPSHELGWASALMPTVTQLVRSELLCGDCHLGSQERNWGRRLWLCLVSSLGERGPCLLWMRSPLFLSPLSVHRSFRLSRTSVLFRTTLLYCCFFMFCQLL